MKITSMPLRMTLASILTLISINSTAFDYDSLFTLSIQQQYNNPDIAIVNFERCLPFFTSQNDSQKIIEIELNLIQLYSSRGYYQKAYDKCWTLLPLLNNNRFSEEKIQFHYNIASLFIIFEQYDKARRYVDDAIELSHKLTDDKTKSQKLAGLYALKAWLNTKENSDFKVSKKLLEQAINENKKNGAGSSLYAEMQLAELYIINDSIITAEKILHPYVQKLKNESSPANSLLFDHVGLIQMKKENYDSAIFYFQKCLASMGQYNNHIDNKIEVLDSLASCYHYLGKNELAFQYARYSSQVGNELFGSKSEMNKELFEIKNEYEEQLGKQHLELLENEKKVLVIKTILYVSVLLLLILVLVIRSVIRSRKTRLLKEKQLFEKQKQEYELENKNKELIASALQLIERDTILDDIGQKLKPMDFKKVNQGVINKLISSINTNKVKKWDEFELYFTSVNENYFKVLKNIYPALSATDLKMCALIKLGLSSKEMAGIMGIEPDSVNTSRSRIRKKMNLSRDVNLIEYLRVVA